VDLVTEVLTLRLSTTIQALESDPDGTMVIKLIAMLTLSHQVEVQEVPHHALLDATPTPEELGQLMIITELEQALSHQETSKLCKPKS